MVRDEACCNNTNGKSVDFLYSPVSVCLLPFWVHATVPQSQLECGKSDCNLFMLYPSLFSLQKANRKPTCNSSLRHQPRSQPSFNIGLQDGQETAKLPTQFCSTRPPLNTKSSPPSSATFHEKTQSKIKIGFVRPNSTSFLLSISSASV